jgi:GT2 family glycosyltransferase
MSFCDYDNQIHTVSVITVTHNRKDKVITLLQSLLTQTYVPQEIILINNASVDGTDDCVRSMFPEVKIISTSQNLGVVAYNLGMSAACGEFVFLIDDDGLPVDGFWIEQTLSKFITNPKLGVVCCKIRMRDTGFTAYDNPQYLPEGNKEIGYPAVSFNGTGAAIRKCVLQEVGFYPDYFFMSFIELHLSSRILDAGWEIRYFPEIEVWHDRPTGTITRFFTYEGMRNYFLYVWNLGPDAFSILRETIRYAGFLYKSALNGKASISLVTRSIFEAIWRLPIALKSRKPVSKSTWDYLFQIRKGEN